MPATKPNAASVSGESNSTQRRPTRAPWFHATHPTPARTRRPATGATARAPTENSRRVPSITGPVFPLSLVSVAITLRNRCQALEERLLFGNRSKFQSSVDDDRRRRHHAVARSEFRVLCEVPLAHLELGEPSLGLVDHAEDHSPGLLALPSAGCGEDLHSQRHRCLATSSRSGISTRPVGLTTRMVRSHRPTIVNSTSPRYRPASPAGRSGVATLIASAMRPVSVTRASVTGFPAPSRRRTV